MTTQEERDEDLAFEQGFNAANAEAADEPTTPQMAEPASPPPAAPPTAQAVDTPAENTERVWLNSSSMPSLPAPETD